MIDSHCHLDVVAFDRDRDDVLARAEAAGVHSIVVPAIRPQTWPAVIALARAHRALRFALGVHPQIVPELSPAEQLDVDAFARAIDDSGALAVGECGLDGDTADPAAQEQLFRIQIRAARATKRPLVIHVFHAHDRAPAILRDERAGDVGGVLHSYSGGAALVPVYRDLGLAFSFAGPVTYANARRPLEAVRAVPAGLLLAGNRRTGSGARATPRRPQRARVPARRDRRDRERARRAGRGDRKAHRRKRAARARYGRVTTHRRFDRTARLVGDEGLARLARSTATVFGLGGVGGFAAEALVRSGVGRVIVVDYDRICVTNVNRQLHAMKATLGKSKVDVMAERLRAINPDAVIDARGEFYRAETSAKLLVPEPDVVIDAIDNMAAKMHLIATCVREKIRIVSAMGAAARLDPTAGPDRRLVGDPRRSVRARPTAEYEEEARHRFDPARRRVGGVLRGDADRPARPRL